MMKEKVNRAAYSLEYKLEAVRLVYEKNPAANRRESQSGRGATSLPPRRKLDYRIPSLDSASGENHFQSLPGFGLFPAPLT